jgi:hypothetical protein
MTRNEAHVVIQAAMQSTLQCGVAIHDVIEILQSLKVSLCDHADHLEIHKRVEELLCQSKSK